MGFWGPGDQPGADCGGQPALFRGKQGAGGCGGVHCAAAATGRGQAASVPGAVWEWVSVPEVRVCSGADAGVCEAAGDILQGVPGALRQYGAVYGEGGGGVDLSQRVGGLCTLSRLWTDVNIMLNL